MNREAVLRVADELESQTRFEDRISSAWMREKAAELRSAVAAAPEPVAELQRVVRDDGEPCKAFGKWVPIDSHKCPAGEFVLREGFRFEYAAITPLYR